MKKKIFYFSTLFITILCLFICIALNDHIYNFNAENVVKNIKYLSSSSFEGRRSGSEENILTSEIIKNKFKDLKLSPYKNSYTEEFITTCPVKTDETVYFKIFNDNESEYLKYGEDYKESSCVKVTTDATGTDTYLICLTDGKYGIKGTEDEIISGTRGTGEQATEVKVTSMASCTCD